jgi:hypothetical protein
MATITINADYASRHCKARLESIEKQFEEDKAKWFEEQRDKQRKRGVWPFKYSYYPTQAELKADFEGKNADNWMFYYCPEMRLRRKHSAEKGVLRAIVTAAEVAGRAGEAEITLDSEEISYLKRVADIAA